MVWLFLIKIDRNDIKMYWRAFMQRQQNIQESVTVLATRQTNHDPIAFADHIEVDNGCAHLAAQAFLQFMGFALDFGRNADGFAHRHHVPIVAPSDP